MALSTAARRAAYSQATSEVFLFLLTISHADLVTPLRFVNNREDITSDGDVYTAYPFGIALPDERDDAPPVVQLSIDNISRAITQAILDLVTPPTVTLTLILAGTPNTIEAGPFAFSLREVGYDALAVQGTLGFEDLLDRPWPSERYTPDLFPALF